MDIFEGAILDNIKNVPRNYLIKNNDIIGRGGSLCIEDRMVRFILRLTGVQVRVLVNWYGQSDATVYRDINHFISLIPDVLGHHIVNCPSPFN